MSIKSSPSSQHSSLCHCSDLRVECTTSAVRWETLSEIACQLHNTTSAKWGDQRCGGYNVARFLHLGDREATTVVIRVPYRPADGWSGDKARSISRQISSEVATMKYIEVHTSIPTPRVLRFNPEVDGGGVGSPYLIMTKVDGVPLSSLWHNMEDRLRESVLRQVVDIILELSLQRFEKIGYLFHQDSDGTEKHTWSIEPKEATGHEDRSLVSPESLTFSSGTDYWMAQSNEKLRTMHEDHFGGPNKDYRYAKEWFMRSLIPALYDNTLDATGFPLHHGDLHSQNIMITIIDNEPRISAIIDWEFSSTEPTSSFAQFPLFIVDYPAWQDDHPQRERNVRDQATFVSLLRQAENKANMPHSLSSTYEGCLGVYLFEQCVTDEIMFSCLFRPLYTLVYGDDREFSVDYYRALERGLLNREMQMFKQEAKVLVEARETLGKELLPRYISKTEFKAIVQKYIHRFDVEGLVRQWLAANSHIR
jgi:hypothetical protein